MDWCVYSFTDSGMIKIENGKKFKDELDQEWVVTKIQTPRQYPQIKRISMECELQKAGKDSVTTAVFTGETIAKHLKK